MSRRSRPRARAPRRDSAGAPPCGPRRAPRRSRPGPAAGLPSMSPPIHEPNVSGGGEPGTRSRQACSRSVAAEIRLCSKNHSPLRISSVIRRRSCRTSSVCHSSVTSSASRSSTSARSSGARRGSSRRIELVGDPDVGEQNRPPRRLGGVRGQHEPDRGRRRTLDELASRDGGQLLERILERLAGDDAVVRILAAAAESVVLLGEVRELEVEPEGAQHERLLLGGERRRRAGDRAVGPRRVRASRLIASTSSRSHSPSCSTSTVPRIVPSTRTSRRSGAAVSPRGLSVVIPGDATSEGRVRRGRRLRRARSS